MLGRVLAIREMRVPGYRVGAEAKRDGHEVIAYLVLRSNSGRISGHSGK